VESEITPDPKPEEAPETRNFLSLLGGVFFSPRETFQEIGRKPRMIFPMIVLMILGAFSAFYLMRKVDINASTRSQLEQSLESGKITQEQMDQQLVVLSKISKVTTPLSVIGGAVGSLIMCLIFAGFGKLFSYFVGAVNQFKPLCVVSMYASIVVTVVSTVLLVIILQLRQPGQLGLADVNSILASNLGAVLESILGMDALPKFVVRLAKAIDIFNIWMIALLAIGFSAVSKKLKTSTAAVWLGTAYVIIHLISAGIQAAIGS
jgi:hypothetical protein